MRLHVNGPIHVSAASPDTLKAGEGITVNDALGQELLEKHPELFSRADDDTSGSVSRLSSSELRSFDPVVSAPSVVKLEFDASGAANQIMKAAAWITAAVDDAVARLTPLKGLLSTTAVAAPAAAAAAPISAEDKSIVDTVKPVVGVDKQAVDIVKPAAIADTTKAAPVPQTKVEPPPATKVDPPAPNTAEPAPANTAQPAPDNKSATTQEAGGQPR